MGRGREEENGEKEGRERVEGGENGKREGRERGEGRGE